MKKDVCDAIVGNYLNINPYVYIFKSSEGNLCIENSKSILKISNKKQSSLIERILSLCDGQHSMDYICSETNNSGDYDVKALLNLLIKNGCIEADNSLNQHNVSQILKNSVPILGTPHGVEMDKRKKYLENINVGIYQEDIIDMPFFKLLSESKINTSQIENIESVNTGNANIIIGIGQFPFSSSLLKLNDLCLKNGIPLLPVGITHQGRAFVGSIILPGGDACCNCLNIRAAANNSAFSSYIGSNICNELDELQSSKISYYTLSTIISGIITVSILKYFGGQENNKTSNKILQINLSASPEIFKIHNVLPVFNCKSCCSYRNNYYYKESGNVNNLPMAVDDTFGIVNSVVTQQSPENQFKVFYNYSISSNLSFVSPNINIINNGGAGYNLQSSWNSAVGESLERYAASNLDKNRLIFGSYKQFGQKACDPSKFQLFSDAQYESDKFPYSRFNENSNINWIKGISWLTKKPFLVPAAMVYLPYKASEGEDRITPSISTGLAAAPTFKEAILRGIYEVIERDAFSLSWLCKISPIKIKNIEEFLPDFWRVMPRKNYVYNFYELTLDINIPVAFVTIDGTSPSDPNLTIGGASRLSLSEALKKSALEAVQGRPYIKSLLEFYKSWNCNTGFSNVDNFQKHAILYSKYPELRNQIDYLIGNKSDNIYRERNYEPAPSQISYDTELDYCLSEIEKSGYDVIVVDLTTTDLRQIGVHVARVLIPGLHGLHGSHKFRFLGGNRLQNMIEKYSCNELNQFAHPYP